jgi:hypothetical protein
MPRFVRLLLTLVAASIVCIPATAYAQTGNIAGTVRDANGGVLPGVLVEVTSPQLIGQPRSTTTDGNGRYQITSLPVGVYKITFKLDNFSTVERSNIEISTDFTAPVNADMKVGQRTEVVTVIGESVPLVDVQNARQRQVFSGDEIRDLPTTRNLGDLVQLVPGIALQNAGGGFNGDSRPQICSGGQGDGSAGIFGTQSFSGSFSGCGPIFEGFNAHSSMNDAQSMNQGRLQVDGLGVQSFGGGGRSSYITDIGNAQEVTFTLSGSLGESETGGTTINVVPRTGGNRFAGNYFTAYSNGSFFDRNDKTRTSTFSNRLLKEYDVNGAYGGPILRDRLWFYSAARRQERHNDLFTNYRNANEGRFGANWKADLPAGGLDSTDLYQNVNTRLTLQATTRNKFNIFWDEQYTCENPCKGPGVLTSPEATGSLLTYPLHVAQLSWTNPLTNKILLDAAVGHYGSHRDETRNRYENAYPQIPRIVESGVSSDYALSVPGAMGTQVTHGSINDAIDWRIDNIQSRASASYITGSHNIKLGYQGQYLGLVQTPFYNDLRMQYTYMTPAATCSPVAPAPGTVSNQSWCGLFPDGVTRMFDGRNVNDPIDPACIPPPGASTAVTNATYSNCPSRLQSEARPPVPTSFSYEIPRPLDQRAWFAAFYVQDQWTWNRFTFNGALRYDNSRSSFGKVCVGPDVYKSDQYCLNDPADGEGQGVNFKDITPRMGVAWDIFGSGKTAIKWSMGKYLDGVSVGGVYNATDPAGQGRTINSLTRTWRDLDGDRVVDCNLVIPVNVPVATQPGNVVLPANGECASAAGDNARRFGRSPSQLDENQLAIGLGTLYCGQDEPSMSQLIRNYCDNYMRQGGTSLIEGWGKRQYEWQTSIGLQHEILPRLSGEVTWNYRVKGNQRVQDAIGAGCDLYSGEAGATVDADGCMQNLLNFQSDFYDFYGVQAPSDPRLPGGGGYVVQGIATPKCVEYSDEPGEENNCVTGISAPASSTNAWTIVPDGATKDYWVGVDTNFVWRAPRGLRISGGTSTGQRTVDTCGLLVGSGTPTGQILMEGRERDCDRARDFQTNLRGTATYTIPWVDVLVASTFSARPGVQINANYTVDIPDLVWGPNSQNRTGTTLAGSSATTVQRNLLSNDTYGERIILADLKLAKNIRFGGRRLNIGFDIFNVFNSDAALQYCATFPNPERDILGCGSIAGGNLRPWRTVEGITTPRYGRFQVTFDF